MTPSNNQAGITERWAPAVSAAPRTAPCWLLLHRKTCRPGRNVPGARTGSGSPPGLLSVFGTHPRHAKSKQACKERTGPTALVGGKETDAELVGKTHTALSGNPPGFVCSFWLYAKPRVANSVEKHAAREPKAPKEREVGGQGGRNRVFNTWDLVKGAW